MRGFIVIAILLVTFSSNLLIRTSVEGVKKISYEEDLNLERQLSILNKKPIQTFKMEGDTYDCIDIYKQPAFDHPLLKHHKIQMKPTYEPNLWNGKPSSFNIGSRTTLQGVGCPSGSVPIRRTEKEELRRVGQFTNAKVAQIRPVRTERAGEHIAILRPPIKNSFYHGARAVLALEGLDVKENQYSTNQMWIESGSPEEYTSLQAGYMVSPHVGGDTKTRFFIYWRSTDLKFGCYNQFCPGFVQIDQKIVPNEPALPLSIYGGHQYGSSFAIFRDNGTGNWWLSLDKTYVGYWPKPIVPKLEGGASTVAWGGVAGGPPNEDSPPMGNGHFPAGDPRKACHVSRILTNDVFNKVTTPEAIETYVDKPTCYGIDNGGFYKGYGLLYMFGGPGGKCGV